MICRNCRCRREIQDDAQYCPFCGWAQKRQPVRHKYRKRGSGSVYKLGGKRSKPWVAVRDGIYIGTFQSAEEAEAALMKMPKEANSRYNDTLEAVRARWVKEKYEGLSKSSRDQYDASWIRLQPLAKTKMRDIRAGDYQAIINSMEGMSRSSCEKLRCLISQLEQAAARDDIIQKQYASLLQLPKNEAKEKDIFTLAEIEKLRRDGSDAAKVVLALIYTGMRINELFQLRAEDYHGTYIIGGEKTDAGRDRVIPIPDAAAPVFASMAASCTDRLIDGLHVNQDAHNFRSRDFNPLMEKLGITGKTPHCTRHTFATRAAKTLAPEDLRRIMGHADISTTVNIYEHPEREHLVEVSRAIWG